MRVVLKPAVKRIRNGYSATSPEFHITAHGFSPDQARMNLEKTALIFLQPFSRAGTLRDELRIAGVSVIEVGEALSVYCEDDE